MPPGGQGGYHLMNGSHNTGSHPLFRKKARRGTGSFDPLNQRPHNVKNVIVRFGLYSGLTASILFLGPFVINPDQAFDPANMVRSEIIGYAAMILSMTLVYFGVRAHRNKLAPQVYPFGDAFRAGILITLISVIVFYFGNVILYEVINPDFLEEFFVVYRQYKIDGGASDTEIAPDGCQLYRHEQWMALRIGNGINDPDDRDRHYPDFGHRPKTNRYSLAPEGAILCHCSATPPSHFFLTDKKGQIA